MMKHLARSKEELLIVNRKSFVKSLIRNKIIKSDEDLDSLMAIIPEKSRQILETRWGLTSGKYCHTFELFDKELGVKNSRKIHDKALADLRRAKYAVILSDREELGWNRSILIGLFLSIATKNFTPGSVQGQEFIERLKNCDLSSLEYEIISLRFGIDSANCCTVDQICKRCNVSPEFVKDVEEKVLRKFRTPSASTT